MTDESSNRRVADSEVRQKFEDPCTAQLKREAREKRALLQDVYDEGFASGMRAGEIARWIPVEEKLPRPQQFVLAFYSEDDMEVTWYTGEVWSGGVSKPTHWQPLPAAPEEKKRDT